MARVMAPATSAVTVSTWANGSLVPVWSGSAPRIDGLTNRMYAIVRNVASPARISVRIDEPRLETSK